MSCFHQHLVERLEGRRRRQMSFPTTRRQLHGRIETRWGRNPSLRRFQNQVQVWVQAAKEHVGTPEDKGMAVCGLRLLHVELLRVCDRLLGVEGGLEVVDVNALA
ncbi:hypothetical protein ColKHC_11615 [Colletotrichum higginsianum]|nr:hypothetical protein ColKHC_11615 [Colletotrichum higginsianum]